MTPFVSLRGGDAASALAAERWWEQAALRRLLARQAATTLGYTAGPSANPTYAVLAVDVTAAYAPAFRTVRRFFVQLGREALVEFDLAAGPNSLPWQLTGSLPSTLRHSALLPKAGQSAQSPYTALNVLHSPAATVESISSMELAGARLKDTVVLLHTEIGMASSAIFFDVTGKAKVRVIVVGLTPGAWEVWRDGFQEETAYLVQPQSGVLSFETEPGNFFIRQR